jgi:hypothetical protein
MNGGAENRKKTIMAGALGAVALCCVIYAYSALFGGSGPPPASSVPAPVASTAAGSTSGIRHASSSAGNSSGNNQLGLGAAAGVAAQKMASTSSSLDPTLDESAMLRTEGLVYSGNGRNIFSATYVPPVALPTNVPNARPKGGAAAAPAPVVPSGPPPPPPIDLKFFGTETRANGQRQVFLLQGDNVYLAAQGDIVARKYKIVGISSNSIQVEDLVNNDTQTLPLQMN